MPDNPPPRRPYLLRALHEWMTDSGQTPQLLVDAHVAGTVVPRQLVDDGRIVLNISHSATGNLMLGNDEVVFDARFSGQPMRVRLPLAAILAIYARESGEGLVFPADEYPGPPEGEGPPEAPGPAPETPTPPACKRPVLKVVK